MTRAWNWRHWSAAALMAVTAVLATVIATQRTAGDFSATLPGGYARTLNPTLWDSPDLVSSWAYHKDTYLHGPVQYLVLYPIVFLNSYHQIAMTLLPLYAAAIALTLVALVRIARTLSSREGLGLAVAAMTVCFFPLVQAYVQREFEVVALLVLSWGVLWLVQDRRALAAAALAVVAWFKYLPLVFAGYLGLRRWGRALVTFIGVSLVILALTEGLFGLRQFFNNNVPDTAANTLTFSRAKFCDQWHPGNETLAHVRHGLCRVEGSLGWPIARDLYVILCVAIAGIYLAANRRLSRRQLAWRDEQWRRALEASIVTTVYACFVFGHYYYLSALVLPLTVLLARALETDERSRLYLWAVAYILLSGLIVPAWILARMKGLNGLHLYMQAALYLYGELWLIGLLLREYWALGRPARADL